MVMLSNISFEILYMFIEFSDGHDSKVGSKQWQGERHLAADFAD
jgi:hypothetical protein